MILGFSTIFPQFSAGFPQVGRWIGALALAGLVAWAAYRAGALSRSGQSAAALVGGVVFAAGGWPWAVLLIAFFASSSAWSRAFAGRKAALSEKFAKGSRRDAGQVLANGGLPALLALAHWLFPGWSGVWAAFAGALAAVNADTWATEVGVLSRVPPRLLVGGRSVERGESGGVTPLGTLASLGGSAAMAALAAAFAADLRLLGAVTLAGALGALLDSALGATVQAQFRCPRCERWTERHPRHTCGALTVHVRGWRWLNNDLVNLTASLCGALLAWLLTVA